MRPSLTHASMCFLSFLSFLVRATWSYIYNTLIVFIFLIHPNEFIVLKDIDMN